MATPAQENVNTGNETTNQTASQITQGSFVNSAARAPEVVNRLTFASDTVKRLSTADFELGSAEMIRLKYDDCILVLFYVENTESYQLANIWGLVAQQVAGPVFAAINMLSERRVAEAFTRLKSDGSSPLHWAGLRQYPFIMVYRKGWPVAVYNGPRSVQAIMDYSLTLACQAGYYEIMQVYGSMQAESREEMSSPQRYIDVPGQNPIVKKTSLEYSTVEPIRGFNPNLKEVATGSKAAAQETQQVVAEEENAAKTGASLTENVENPNGVTQGLNETPEIAVPATNTPTAPAT